MTDNQSSSSNAASNSAAPTTVGALLRQNRERAGLGIADVARVLRISQKYLEALEDARHEDLPGMPYAIGFVRSYAEHLHLDSEEIVRRYKDEASGVNGKNDLVFPKPIADGGVPGGAVLGLGVMVAAVAYGVWYWNANQAEMEMEIARVEPVPEHMAAKEPISESPTSPAGEPSPSAASTSSEAQDTVVESSVEPAVEAAPMETVSVNETPVEAVVSEVAPTVEEPDEPAAPSVADTAEQVVETMTPAPEPVVEAPSEESVESPVEEPVETVVAAVESAEDAAVEPAAETVTEAAAEAETPEAAPQAASEAITQDASEQTASVDETTTTASVAPQERQNDGPSRITVRAKSNSWIQVRDEIADRLLFTRLLREGDEYQVPNRAGLRLMTGNAGALELLVDGSAVPSIGDVGEVRRNVELDADKLQNGSAVTE